MTSHALNHLERIDSFIRIKGTGTANDLAKKLGISRRNVYYYLGLMKDHGAPIKYCNYRNTYYYEEKGSFIIKFHFETMD